MGVRTREEDYECGCPMEARALACLASSLVREPPVCAARVLFCQHMRAKMRTWACADVCRQVWAWGCAYVGACLDAGALGE